MCYQIIELYAACRCLYHEHAVDGCASYGRPGHSIERRTIYVGYACPNHVNACAGHLSRSVLRPDLPSAQGGHWYR